MNFLLICSLPTPDIFCQWSFSLAAHVNTYVLNIESKQSSVRAKYRRRLRNRMWQNLWNGITWVKWSVLRVVIIHSKYFSFTKSYAQFIITSFCGPNLKELCDTSTDDVSRAAKLPNDWTVNREDLGWGWVVLVLKAKCRNIPLVSRKK